MLPRACCSSATDNICCCCCCCKAIDAGLEAFAAKQFSEAIDLFNLALELPGNGEAAVALCSSEGIIWRTALVSSYCIRQSLTLHPGPGAAREW
jgi:hypothetical protein